MFLNDQETETDLLYYEPIANTIVSLIRENPAVPVTIGVHGDWGAGKSSVLKMTSAALAKQGDSVLCIWFNGWTFEGFGDAKTVVIETIVEELRSRRSGFAMVTERATSLLQRVDKLKLAKMGLTLGFNAITGLPTASQIRGALGLLGALGSRPDLSLDDLQSAALNVVDLFKGDDKPPEDNVPRQIHALRSEFSALLDAAKVEQLVVIVDDLDRCLPETAVATLEAIRLFLMVPRTAFVIGADETMIEYAVRKHFPDLPPTAGSVSYTRNYLEKLIQVPFRIPALGLAETRTYIALLLAESAMGRDDPGFRKLLAVAREDLRRPWTSRGLDHASVQFALGNDVPDDVKMALAISAQVTRVLTDGTQGNPRQVKRFLNTLMLRHAVAEARGFGEELRRPALAKLMLAERFAPDLYDLVARESAASNDGKAEVVARLEDQFREGHGAKPGDGAESSAKASKRRPTKQESEPEPPWMDWAKGWAVLDPPMKDVDLRPYVFVTREKRSFLGGLAPTSQLAALVDRLMSGRLGARGAAGEVKKLTGTQPKEVFDALRARIVLEAESYETAPGGADGLVVLVEAHAGLAKALLAFLRELPIGDLGPWAASHFGSCLREPAIAAEYAQLLQEWSTQNENAGLKAAAEGVLTMATRRR